MVRIAIVEDDAASAELLHKQVRQYSKECHQDVQVNIYADGEDIAEPYDSGFDIILMDIEMPFMDGMTAAETIRKKDGEVVIIFITCSPHYAIRGYSVGAMDYLLKPVSYFALSERLDRAIRNMSRKKRNFMLIQNRKGLQKIPVSDITYVESQGHRQVIHTSSSVYETQSTMREMEENLIPCHFARCNNGYLVNLAQVDGVQDNMVQVGGDSIIVSRTKRKEFMQQLVDFLNEELL